MGRQTREEKIVEAYCYLRTRVGMDRKITAGQRQRLGWASQALTDHQAGWFEDEAHTEIACVLFGILSMAGHDSHETFLMANGLADELIELTPYEMTSFDIALRKAV